MTPRSVAIIGTRGYPSYYGGFETAVRMLAPYLAERGWDVTVYGRSGSIKQDDPTRDDRVHIRTTPGLETRSLSTLSYGFTSVLDSVRRRPDVALVMNVANGFWLPLLRMRGIPSLVNVDGIEWERDKWSALGKRVFRSGARATARHAAEIVCDAVAIQQRWSDEFGRSGYFIPYGGSAPEDLPVEPGLTHRGYALMVARFVPENTVAEFVEAAREIAKKHDVVIVGSSGYGGELEECVRELAASSDRVHWLGHISDDRRLLALWQHSGAYFHGHSVGGTNPALVQAMACGAPTVARDTVYNREVLGEAGVVTAAAPEKIASSITKLLESPETQERLSAAGRVRASEHYSWEGVCAAYEEALLEVASRRSRA